jgi:predicted kinase
MVTLMSGLPGAGKDTWLHEHAPELPIISLDRLRDHMGIAPTDNQGPVIAQAKELAREYLREGRDFAWNATNIARQLRGSLIDLFANYNARVRIVYVEVAWDDLLRRNQTRDEPVPVNVLCKLAQKLDVPDLTEAHEVMYST